MYKAALIASAVIFGCVACTAGSDTDNAGTQAPNKAQGNQVAQNNTPQATSEAQGIAPPEGVSVSTRDGELPSWKIPNLGEAAEAYYGPDSTHLIAQVQDERALRNPHGGAGFLTKTFTDAGTDIVTINAKGYDACSYFSPDGKSLVWTSVRDHMGSDEQLDGNWSDWRNYPKGAELYKSDRQGNNVQRLTDNPYYDAEVSVSPDGKWILFGRKIDGNMDLWVMNADGTDEHQITFTDDWQEGGAFFLPDSNTILFRAWKASEYDQSPTPMTIFTIQRDGSNLQQQSFTDDMNWAPYPAPDGKHYVFVRIVPDTNNWEVYLGEIGAGPDAEPKRLTFSEGFDGFPSLSPDGRKMVWVSSRSSPDAGFMQHLRLHVMDVSSLDLGPQEPG